MPVLPTTMAKSKSELSSKGGGCLMLFALPFAGFGLFMAGMVVRDFWTWSAAQSWAPTPARLLKAEARENSDSDGGTTYRAVAEYRYEFGDKTYESDRVAVHAGSDNIGSYQRDRARELVQLKNAGKPITCYVNPDNPSEAILFRDLRPGMLAFKSLFALVFGGVGFGLLYGGVWATGDAKRTAALAQQYPDKPWKWKETWRTGRIRSNGGAAAWAVGLFAALWNAISWPVIIGIILQGQLEFGPILLVLLFPIIGILLAWWAIYLIARRVKWGVSEFEMATLPGVLGGPLAGMIHAPANIAAQDGFTIRLACIETVRERSGGETNSREVTRWDHEKTIVRDLSRGDRTLIPVQFIIPYGLPSSGEDDIKWKLTAEAKTDGVDYHAEFEVPVFETPASSKNPPSDVESAADLYAAPPEFATIASRLGAVLEEDFPDRRTLYFPMARNRGLAIGLSLATIICLIIAAATAISPAPVLIPIGVGFVGVLLLLFAGHAVLERSRLEFGRRGVAYQRSIIRAGQRVQFEPQAIKEIEVDRSGTEVNGVPYWKVVLRTHEGAEHTLATEIKARPIADRLADEISAAIGVKEASGTTPAVALEAELPEELRS
jgi:hypothetical protein